VLEEAADRYGPLPPTVLNLADYGRIRVMADRLGIDTIDREGRTVVLKFRPQAKVDPVRLVNLVRQRSDLTLVPPAGLRLTLDGAGTAAKPEDRKRHAVSRQDGVGADPRLGPRSRNVAPPSWWTARARTGEVTAGFSKQEILRPAKEDPRAPGGI